MTQDVNIQLFDFPNTRDREMVVKNEDDTYTVFINTKLSSEGRLRSFRHALHHIKRNDFDKEDVQIVECTARIDMQKQHMHSQDCNGGIGLLGLVNAYKHGCKNLHETADFLDVAEEYLLDAIQYYREKFGLCTALGNYLIYFEPSLGVFEMTEYAQQFLSHN